MKITCISDTHGRHDLVTEDLAEGGDLLIHAGDCMNSGTIIDEARQFLDWFARQPFREKVMIAGNHDRLFENEPDLATQLLAEFPSILYLQDQGAKVAQDLEIYGAPWQPKFCDWAFNLPRGGSALKEKWSQIPSSTDILVTHGPPQEILDTSGPPHNEPLLGCEHLRNRVSEIRPQLHVFGHIHGGYGMREKEGSIFVNAAVLNERYQYTNKPIQLELSDPSHE